MECTVLPLHLSQLCFPPFSQVVFLNILNQKPFFVESPRTRTAAVGQQVFMRCFAKGYPAPEVSWTFNGRQVESSSDPNLELAARGDLVVRRVTQESQGVYECAAHNEFGRATAKGELTVVDKATIELVRF